MIQIYIIPFPLTNNGMLTMLPHVHACHVYILQFPEILIQNRIQTDIPTLAVFFLKVSR